MPEAGTTKGQARQDRSARAREAAAILPLAGLFLLVPPVLTLFAVPIDVGGVPLIVVYLFGIWLSLIACAALLGRVLDLHAPHGPSRQPPDSSA